MKPLVSIIPEPDRSTEARKPLTPKQRAELALAQGGLCGCGCGGKLNHATEGTIDEHLRALGLQGTNAMENRSLWRKPCSDAKTYGADLPTMAKADAQGGKTGQYARRQKRGGSMIQGGGFGPSCRKMSGSIGLTKKALRLLARSEGEVGG